MSKATFKSVVCRYLRAKFPSECDEFADSPIGTYKVRETITIDLFMAAGRRVCYDSPSENWKMAELTPKRGRELSLSIAGISEQPVLQSFRQNQRLQGWGL